MSIALFIAGSRDKSNREIGAASAAWIGIRMDNVISPKIRSFSLTAGLSFSERLGHETIFGGTFSCLYLFTTDSRAGSFWKITETAKKLSRGIFFFFFFVLLSLLWLISPYQPFEQRRTVCV
jgi:hypothetical protein